MTRWALFAVAVAAAFACSVSHAHAACTSAPVIATVAAVGNSQAELVYTGVCGSTVKVKEKRANGSGSCGLLSGCNAYYFEPNSGDVTVTSVYGPGPTTFRVCDISGPTEVCSVPVVTTIL